MNKKDLTEVLKIIWIAVGLIIMFVWGAGGLSDTQFLVLFVGFGGVLFTAIHILMAISMRCCATPQSEFSAAKSQYADLSTKRKRPT